MRDYVEEAAALAKGKSREDLEKNRVLNLALTRLLEVVGEAANRVSGENRKKYPGLPWPQIIGSGTSPSAKRLLANFRAGAFRLFPKNAGTIDFPRVFRKAPPWNKKMACNTLHLMV